MPGMPVFLPIRFQLPTVLTWPHAWTRPDALHLPARAPKQFSAGDAGRGGALSSLRHGLHGDDRRGQRLLLPRGRSGAAGEGHSYLHGRKFSALEDLSGKQLRFASSGGACGCKTAGWTGIKLSRGSLYENFKSPGCIRAVHQAYPYGGQRREAPRQVPADVFPLASSNYIDRFYWYQCALDGDQTEIVCQSWYPNGDLHGKDFFCARTLAGEPVGAVATLDPLLSETGRLVLKSGIVVRHDNRSRTNDVLDRPNEACR